MQKQRETRAMRLLGTMILSALLLSLLASGQSIKANDAALDFCVLEPAFVEDFNDMSIGSRQIGSHRWIAHTPWNGDFGEAIFTDPGPGFPFVVREGALLITAKKDREGQWRSGLIASADGDRQGFSLQYGYFEARAKLPSGPGVWPAFWLGSSEPAGWTEPSIEIDILEYYGHAPDAFQSAMHIWHKNPVRSDAITKETKVQAGSLTEEFHTYGAKVDPAYITYYFDRQPIWQIATPPTHKSPLLLMANLALGSGFAIDKTPDPSVMVIDYIHAYKFKSSDHEESCNRETVSAAPSAREP